ncbi:M28 family peptidase [Roseivirga sp. E12]|uniref:M28 family peptidase n=1 Tax=Roseivirga sp. E12 TaxID=2819237 RepID=UPI001ABC467B|nr:M28 family peptidase [Roseivirga sp. E12]MBO3698930.1 M28 family peptidase [Roseivirga sp. E12]
MRFKNSLVFLTLVTLVFSCGGNDSSKGNSNVPAALKPAPTVNADSVYTFVQKQVDFGPRVPNTQAHREASKWFKEKFESYGASVIMQNFTEYIYDGTKAELTNVIASFNPEKKKRILLAAHWDTRPFADRDADDTYAAIDGANDGGSGVGVLLEVARLLSENQAPNVGVDIILFDGEDWGEHFQEGSKPLPDGKDVWWCLGSQYWSKNKHKSGYTAYYGILLDMVGAPNATFLYDSVSRENAGRTLDKVWGIAGQLGYGTMFKKQNGFEGIIDDHVYVNNIARIPMIDIIDYRENTGSFTPAWHTADDNMENISKETLSAVTSVLMSVLYNE